MTIATSRRSVGAFERQASDVLGQLRAALSALIDAIPGRAKIRRAADIERALGVRMTLAWQVHRVATADDPLAEVKNVPGHAGMARFLQAASTHGVADRIVQTVSDAFDEFEALVNVHAGDRKTFDSMVSGFVAGGSDRIAQQRKRLAFMGNNHIFGAQAKTQLACYVLQPAQADPDRIDHVGIRGLIELRRVRSDALWVISNVVASDDDGTVLHPVIDEPIDPTGVTEQGVALLPEFCSKPLPALESIQQGSGITAVVLRGNGIGIKAAETCILGNVHRSVLARFQDEHNRVQRCHTRVRMPCEVLVHDVLVHKDMCGPIAPEVYVYGDHRDVDTTSPRESCDLLGMQEYVVHLGKGLSVLHTPDVPRYPEMVQFAFDRLGWDGDRFDVYRCRVEYPVMPSSVVVQFDLPMKPNAAAGQSE